DQRTLCEVGVRVDRKHGRGQPADRLDLLVNNRLAVPVYAQDLDHAERREDGKAIFPEKPGEAVAGEQGEIDVLPAVRPAPAPVDERQERLYAPSSELPVHDLFMA